MLFRHVRCRVRRIPSCLVSGYVVAGHGSRACLGLGFVAPAGRDAGSHAEAVVERDANDRKHFAPASADQPAVASACFRNVNNGVLTVVWKDGQLCAQVLGMTWESRERGYVPETWTEINLIAELVVSDLATSRASSRFLWTTTVTRTCEVADRVGLVDLLRRRQDDAFSSSAMMCVGRDAFSCVSSGHSATVRRSRGCSGGPSGCGSDRRHPRADIIFIAAA